MGSWKAPRLAQQPAGLLAAANQLVSPVDDVLWAAKTPDESSTPSPPARSSARTWPPSRPPPWPRVRTARSPRTTSPGPPPGTRSPTSGTHQRTGRGTVRHAKLLVGDRSLTRDALRDGLVFPEQAGVICDAIEELPDQPPPPGTGREQLLDEAGRLHATDLTKAARHLIHVVDPEGAERKAEKDPVKARLVELRPFAGLTIEEAALALGIWVTTANRYWSYARAWLHQAVAGEADSGGIPDMGGTESGPFSRTGGRGHAYPHAVPP